MRHLFRLSTIAFLAVLFVMASKTAMAADDTENTYDEYDTVDDVGMYTLLQDVDHHFSEARENLEDGNNKEAANEIRKAAILLEIEEHRARQYRPKSKEAGALAASISRLYALANDIDKGTVTSVQPLHDAFAQVQLALAMNSWVSASENFLQQDFVKAYRSLEASKSHLKQAEAWSKPVPKRKPKTEPHK
jgi:hypothetical protein